ncbi:MAG TPA: magnesium/cobalt transporter CorA [Dehalococcoidia bacterium]|jgi:magnesium transporter|nr:magnesium/cobalt transporter CorA [Dehalococcoidia bacterium]
MSDRREIIAFYRVGAETAAQTADLDALERALSDPDGLVWIDLDIQTEEDATVLRDVFQFHPLAIEDCVSERVDPAKIDDYGGYIFVIVQAVTEYRFGEEMEPVEVDFFLGPNYVVSCHRDPVPAIVQFRERCRRDDSILSHHADWVLHGLLDSLVDEYLPIVDTIDDDIDSLEGIILRKPDTALLQHILTAKRNALRLRRATIPQRDIMNRLSRNEFPQLIRPEMSMYYRDVYDHLVRIEYLVEALRDIADGVLNTYLSVTSNRLNEVMKVLTAVGAIFLPGALIAGIYGTNFPENAVWPSYNSEWGFWVVVALIIGVTLGLLAFLRYRNWI